MKTSLIVRFQPLFCSLCLLLLASPGLVAQQLIERTVCVFDFAPLADTDSSYARLCSDTISIELEILGYTLIANEQIRKTYTGSLRQEDAMVQTAQQLGADVAVLGFYTIDSTGIHIGVKAIDIITGLPAVALSESGTAGFEVFDTIDAVAARVAGQIRQALKPLPASEIIVHREEITVETTIVEEVVSLGTPISQTLLSKDEGAQIIAGEAVLGTVQDGIIVIDTIEGIRLDLTIRKAGFHDGQLSLNTSNSGKAVPIPRLLIAANYELLAQSNLQKPYGLELAFQRLLARNVFSAGVLAGLFYLPLAYNSEADSYVPEDAASFQERYGSGYLNASAALCLGFYPSNIIWPKGGLRPALNTGLQFDTYSIGDRPLAYSFSLRISASLAIILNRVLLNFELGFYPDLRISNLVHAGAPLFALKTGVGYRW